MEIFLSILLVIQVSSTHNIHCLLFSYLIILILFSTCLRSYTVEYLLTVPTKLHREEHAPSLLHACTFFIQFYSLMTYKNKNFTSYTANNSPSLFFDISFLLLMDSQGSLETSFRLSPSFLLQLLKNSAGDADAAWGQ